MKYHKLCVCTFKKKFLCIFLHHTHNKWSRCRHYTHECVSRSHSSGLRDFFTHSLARSEISFSFPRFFCIVGRKNIGKEFFLLARQAKCKKKNFSLSACCGSRVLLKIFFCKFWDFFVCSKKGIKNAKKIKFKIPQKCVCIRKKNSLINLMSKWGKF